jgi:predicted dehydrogenase
VAAEFLQRGIHLLIEKPLACNLEQADELLAVARQHGCLVQVGHVERFNPALTAALPYLDGPRYIESVRAGGFTFRSTDVGVVLDLMIHDLDIVLSLVDAPVSRVEALGVAVLGKHEDVAQARLEFANGCVAHLSASRISYVPRRQMQVWAQRAFATVDFASRTVHVVEPSEAVLKRQIDVDRMTPSERSQAKETLLNDHLPQRSLRVEPSNALSEELANFVAAIRKEQALRVPGEQGRAALCAAHAVLASIETHVWQRATDGPILPLTPPAAAALRGPHWTRSAGAPAEASRAGRVRREAG